MASKSRGLIKLNISAAGGIGLNKEIEIEIQYSIRFTPMECLLAFFGLKFREKVEIFEVESESSTEPKTDDDGNPKIHKIINYISGADIAGTIDSSLILKRTVTDTFKEKEINFGEPYLLTGPPPPKEKIRARVTLEPDPSSTPMVEGFSFMIWGILILHS